MLQDPEGNLEEWTEEIAVPFDENSASMKTHAMAKCQNLINDDPLAELIGVYQRTKTPNRAGNVKWICQYRSERPRNYADDYSQN
jgi:hypothetical protein